MAAIDLAVIGVLSWLAATGHTIRSGPLPMIVVPLGAATGYLCRRALGLPLAVAIVVILEVLLGDANPFVVATAAGSWVVGALFRDHRLLAEQLRVRSQELVAEGSIYAAESVRHERARIARELHDIVGHSLSVVVLQAAAGERLVDGSPEAAAQALEDIARVARQAQDEIGALVALLTPKDDELAPLPVLTHRLVDAAAASGLNVTCRIDGTLDIPAGDRSHAAYRIIQEAVTNALRHAPGAPIRIGLYEDQGCLRVEVRNGPPKAATPEPADLVGGYGLEGMRERVATCGGTLDAGPTLAGGWQVTATFATIHPNQRSKGRTKQRLR